MTSLEAIKVEFQLWLLESLRFDGDHEQSDCSIDQSQHESNEQNMCTLMRQLPALQKLVPDEQLQDSHGQRFKEQLDDTTLLIQSIDLLLSESEHAFNETEEFHSNNQISALSCEDHGQACANGHEFGGYLNENEVEGADEGQEDQFEEDLAAGVPPDLRWLIHALEEQHVDHGRVGDQVDRRHAHENEHGGKLVRIVPRMALARPVDGVEQDDISDVVRNLGVRTEDSNDQRNHVLLQLVL